MEELKLHAEGQEDHLKSLWEKYEGLRKSLIGNKDLTQKQKSSELEKINEQFTKEKKDSNNNLY